MLRHADYTRDRIKQLVGRIHDRIYAQRRWIDDLRVAGPVERIPYAQAQKLIEFRPARAGDQYGPVWATFWFRAEATVPPEWAGGRVDLLWDTQSEATLWIDGRSVQGLNMTQGDRPDAILLDRARGGERLAFQVEMACNNKFGASTGEGSSAEADVISRYHLRRAEIALFNPAAWTLYHDAATLLQLYQQLEKDGDVSERSWRGLLLGELNRFANTIDADDESTWPAGREILAALYRNHNASRQFELTAIGHAHIDTAWLWPLAETWRKCERTFSTATAYMRDYPEYRFSCSQAYQYNIIRQRNPDLYGRIRERVKGGQWVIVGGTWIEPDCNIPSGESLCRQFLQGQRFFEREFGVRCREFWNPDVFGYNGQLPQIMNLAGIRRFLTQKLSWNRFNKPHHHTFTWQGVDGSEVLAHFPPQDTYNSTVTVEELRRNMELYRDHDRSHHGIVLFGYGDGGGGPTRTMLETLRRAQDLQGIPRTRQRSSDEFFALLEADITDRPVQVGELYFEYHRGTYTSQALVKKNNRKSEHLLHDIEFLAAATGQRVDLAPLWETLLLNQFHDILPGSSIAEVYEDSARQFQQLQRDGEALIERLAGRGETPLNTIACDRVDVIERGGRLSAWRAAPLAAAEPLDEDDPVTVRQATGQFILENRHLRAVFTTRGNLVSLIHRPTGRESLAGEGNVFETYDDRPTNFDAWDVDPFHLETRRVCPPADTAAIVRGDPLRGEIRFERKIGRRSTLVQIARLDAHARRLELHHEVDWHEDQTMLKLAFPINARSMNATYEMQFHAVERPTHYNTPYDLARYEVPLHKWFDLGEHGFGVSILTESKYGGSTFGNTMRVSLLRAPLSPDPTCDRGRHAFAIALFPHAGDWRSAGTVAEAMRFNAPLRLVGHAPQGSFAAVDDPNLVLDTIKPAEDGRGIVLRLYEAHGGRGQAVLRLARPAGRAVFCNILEEELSAAPARGDTISLDYRPFQIISLRIE